MIDVEQPYCVLELNHPKQIQRTNIAEDGLNPYVTYFFLFKFLSLFFLQSFWDERLLFLCDDASNQIRLQIIDRRKTHKRTGNDYDSSIHFFFHFS